MKSVRRFLGTYLLFFGVLAGLWLFAVIKIVLTLTDDEKVQYLLIGYYIAIHNDLVKWAWKKLRIEKENPEA